LGIFREEIGGECVQGLRKEFKVVLLKGDLMRLTKYMLGALFVPIMLFNVGAITIPCGEDYTLSVAVPTPPPGGIFSGNVSVEEEDPLNNDDLGQATKNEKTGEYEFEFSNEDGTIEPGGGFGEGDCIEVLMCFDFHVPLGSETWEGEIEIITPGGITGSGTIRRIQLGTWETQTITMGPYIICAEDCEDEETKPVNPQVK
jgi:hypothetical protein